LSGYIKKRGKVEGLAFGSPLAYWPHPKTGGLDVVVVRAFLRQLGLLHVSLVICITIHDLGYSSST
jgi:hypothetical protein